MQEDSIFTMKSPIHSRAIEVKDGVDLMRVGRRVHAIRGMTPETTRGSVITTMRIPGHVIYQRFLDCMSSWMKHDDNASHIYIIYQSSSDMNYYMVSFCAMFSNQSRKDPDLMDKVIELTRRGPVDIKLVRDIIEEGFI